MVTLVLDGDFGAFDGGAQEALLGKLASASGVALARWRYRGIRAGSIIATFEVDEDEEGSAKAAMATLRALDASELAALLGYAVIHLMDGDFGDLFSLDEEAERAAREARERKAAEEEAARLAAEEAARRAAEEEAARLAAEEAARRAAEEEAARGG